MRNLTIGRNFMENFQLNFQPTHVLEFNPCQWLKQYVDFNTQK